MAFTLALAATVSAIAVPQLLAGVEDARAAGAVRYLSTKLYQVRMEALMRSQDVGIQFMASGGGYTYAIYADGNGDGIRTRDIKDGTDPCITPPERLPDRFSGVDFGVIADLPPVDTGGAPPGADPIKLGPSNILTFSPMGSSSTGSLYVRGRSNAQFVIRIAGDLGKPRVLRFNPGLRAWTP